MMESDSFFVPTRASSNKDSYQEIIVCDQKSKLTKHKNVENHNLKDAREEIDMKRARFEVYKFAQSALAAPEKQKSKIELAIKLGAKPPKNKSENYKKIQEDKKKQQEEARRKKELYNISQNPTPISKMKSKLNKGTLRRKRKIGSGILNIYGKVNKRTLKEARTEKR